ncbi:hypothetical protein AB0I54_42250 [Streptomyces sp. NPDC050625]|uniref:hypothetical protein n=1 Tax=Streptomyces sp. NPDC050625 TaxID=3154629 RepID=UPI003440D3CA
MGFFRSDPPVVQFEAVIDTDGMTWQAYTDENGVLVIDTAADVEVFVNRAIVDGCVYPAWVDDYGQLVIELDS